MKMTLTLVKALSLCVALLLLACDPVEGSGEAEPASSASDNASAAAVEDDPGGGRCDGNCSEGEPPAAPEGPLTETTSVGAALPDSVETVEVSAIVADPESFAGRTVRVTGRVRAFCHHRRAWYAIDVPGASPPFLRVMTAPNFFVPPGIMNARATAVGTIEVNRVPGSRRAHFEREHGLTSGEDETGRAVRAVLRATGATFEPAAG